MNPVPRTPEPRTPEPRSPNPEPRTPDPSQGLRSSASTPVAEPGTTIDERVQTCVPGSGFRGSGFGVRGSGFGVLGTTVHATP